VIADVSKERVAFILRGWRSILRGRIVTSNISRICC